MRLAITVCIAIVAAFGACDGDSSNGDNAIRQTTGTLTATVGTMTYSATSMTMLTSGDLILTTSDSTGGGLGFTFLEITSAGAYPFAARSVTTGARVRSGFSGGGEQYNIEMGTITLTTFSNDRIVGTFVGTARGLFGAADLAVTNGVIDVRY